MNSGRILVVDDEENVRDCVARFLSREGFGTETADGAQAALQIIDAFRPDLVLTDMKMPGMDGVELTRHIKKSHPDTSVIMISGYPSIDAPIESFRLGVDDYLQKPIDWKQALASIDAALHKRAAALDAKKHVAELEQRVSDAQKEPAAEPSGEAKDVADAEERLLNTTALDMVESLATVLGVKAPETKERSRKVSICVARMAEFLSFPLEQVRSFRLAGLLHDVGMIAIPSAIRSRNPEEMTSQELQLYKEHPVTSHKMLRPVKDFQPILGAVLHHHESFDGSGFPDGLSGENIPIGARMIAVADRFVHFAEDSNREEFVRKAFALEHLMCERETRLAPKMVDVFAEIVLSLRL